MLEVINSIKKIVCSLFIVLMLGFELNVAQAEILPGESAQVMQRAYLPGTSYQIGMEIAKWPPNFTKQPHMHTAPELVYVEQGEVILKIKGQAEKIITAGESFQTPAGVVHQTKAGPQGAVVFVEWAVERGKPFSIPATM